MRYGCPMGRGAARGGGGGNIRGALQLPSEWYKAPYAVCPVLCNSIITQSYHPTPKDHVLVWCEDGSLPCVSGSTY